MVFIYVLKQQNNKYYVGKTSSPKFRLDTHFKTGGCAWTKKYKPTQIIGLFPDCDVFDEDKYTIKYMKKYGIENVRGGSFCQVSLDRETKRCVERMICSANDGCHFCGEQGHFIRNCPKNKFKKRNKEFLAASKGYESADEVEFEDSDDESCWACSYCNKEFDTKKGAQFHENVHCKVKKQYEDNDEGSSEDEDEDSCGEDEWDFDCWQEEKKSSSKCRKCGRNGHYTNKCYASRHVRGYPI